LEKEVNPSEEKKDYLKSYKKTRNRLNSLELQLEQIKIDMVHVRSCQSDGMPRGKGETNDLSRYMEQMADLEEQIDNKRLELMDRQLKITTAINTLDDDDECTILTEKYLNCKTWEKVSEDNSYSWRTVHRIHGRALKKINLENLA
jgi:ATP-dependent protease HslVU (ClpYQ) ATPase subunit